MIAYRLASVKDAHHWFQSSSEQSACIVQVGAPEDVAAVLRIVARTRTPFAVMSGGHASNPGFSSTRAVHVSLRRLDQVVLKAPLTLIGDEDGPHGGNEELPVVEVGFGTVSFAGLWLERLSYIELEGALTDAEVKDLVRGVQETGGHGTQSRRRKSCWTGSRGVHPWRWLLLVRVISRCLMVKRLLTCHRKTNQYGMRLRVG